MKTQIKLTQFQTRAMQLYQDLAGSNEKFIASTNYWRAGNTFDTLTDFMLLALNQNLIIYKLKTKSCI